MKLLIHTQTLTVQPWILQMDKFFHPTFYRACEYSSVPGLKLNLNGATLNFPNG